jgi:CBS domain-containing protein
MLVREVMTSPAVTVTPYTTAHEALRLLDEYRITALPALDDDGRVVGVVSETDLLAMVPDADPGLPRPQPVRVRELMSQPAVTVSADSTVAEAVRLMTAAAVRSLPVVVDDRIVGIVSRSDLIHTLAHADDLIRTEVIRHIRAAGSDWMVEVTDRIVTISGPVTDEQRHHAEELAGTVHGVADVRCR